MATATHTQQQQQQHSQQQHSQSKPATLDWLSFPEPTNLEAPTPDLFDFELDNALSAPDHQQVQLLTLDYNTEAFQYFRSETPQHGPPSVVTASSESAYETLSQHSESLYNYSNPSPSNYGLDPAFTADFGLDFNGLNVQNPVADLTMPSIASLLSDRRDSSSQYSGYNGHARALSAYSGAGSGYLPASGAQGGIAPHHTSSRPSGDSPKSTDGHGGGDNDPRKKYSCHHCTRSFARAYNLKTHLATHDPSRLKPYVCSHRSCGRSFSRKHDLGRHLVSIHREDTGSQYSVASGHSTASQRSESVHGMGIGINAADAIRSWCDSCGRGYLGAQRACNCADVK